MFMCQIPADLYAFKEGTTDPQGNSVNIFWK